MAKRVSIQIEDGVADVQLARPEKMNAIDADMFRDLTEAGASLAQDPSLRAVVLSGQGRAFCAGLDMGSFQAMGEGPRQNGAGARDRGATEDAGLFERGESPANRAQRAAWVWQELPVPVIAAVHGVAYGGGLQIALGADLRIVAPDARLSVMEIKWGLIPDMSGTQTLRQLLPLDPRRQDAPGPPVARASHAADQRVDAVPIALRHRAPLEHHHADPFAEEGPVCAGVEGTDLAAT